MADHLGDYNTSTTVRFAFTTHQANGAAAAPSSAFESADLKIYKDGSATQRSSTSGITMTSPFDSIVGLHLVTIDLSDNTDAGFWAAGSDYMVVLNPDDETVDSVAPLKVLAYFSIERAKRAIDDVNTLVDLYLDASISSRLAAASAAAAVWGAARSSHTSSGTFGEFVPANLTHIAGSAVSTSTAQLGVNVVNAGGTAWGSGAITSSVLASGAITAGAIAADAIGASELAADAAAEIATAVRTELATELGRIDASVSTRSQTSVNTVDTVADSILAHMISDRYIDTDATPWQEVWVVQGGTLGNAPDELVRRDLFDVDGNGIEDTTTFVGSAVT